MLKAVKALGVLRHVPVVQKEIMQQRAPDDTPAVHVQIQFSAQPVTVISHGNAVLQARNIGVLNKRPHPLNDLGFQQFQGTVRKILSFTLG